MLPLFQIISPTSTLEKKGNRMTEIPPKPRRKKKLEVPVHRSNREEQPTDLNTHKTYSAQFNSRRKNKQRALEFGEQITKSPHRFHNHPHGDSNMNVDALEADGSLHRINKKQLANENERLAMENRELFEKLNESTEYYNKRINRMKEKSNSLHKFNEDVLNENNILKTQYQDLLINFEECKNQLELSRNCQCCEEYKRELNLINRNYSLLQNTNRDLNEDMNMLKTVVYRLNVQLERYQEKLRQQNINVGPGKHANQVQAVDSLDSIQTVTSEKLSVLTGSHGSHAHTPISWGKVNTHTLGPLLDSYQETIKEKDEIIQNYEAEFSSFTGKLKEIIRENETLYKRLTEDNQCSKKLSEEIEKIKTELKNTKEQNDLLIKKCALKQDKLEEILKCYETKVEQMKRDYNVVIDQYHRCKTEVGALKERNKSLVEAQDDFKNERHTYIPMAVHSSSVNECKKLYEELKSQYETEKEKLKETISSLNIKITELSETISTLNTDKADLEKKLKLSEKHIKKAEEKYLDLQHTLHEIQLSRSACRKQLNKTLNFARDLVTEHESLLTALNQRRQENKVVKQIGSDMANRMDSLKNQLKSVQRDAFQELSTVEQRIQEQDSLISTMKKEHDEEVDHLKQIIKDHEESNLLLRTNSSIPTPHYLLFRDKNLNM